MSSSSRPPCCTGEGRSSTIASSRRSAPRCAVATPQVDGEDVPVVGAVLERGDDLLVGDLLALEVALHQRLGVLGDLVHELLAVLLRELGEIVGDRDLLAVVLAGAVVGEGLHVDEVDQPADVVLGADRDLRRDDVRPEGGLQRLQRAEEVRPLAVEHVHVDQPGHAELLRALPQALRADLDADDRVDHEHGRLAHAQRAERVGDEGRLAGVSIRLTLTSRQSKEASDAEIDMPRDFSSSSASETVVPSATEPSLVVAPASNSRASCSDVFPLPRWPTNATLRILSAGWDMPGTSLSSCLPLPRGGDRKRRI